MTLPREANHVSHCFCTPHWGAVRRRTPVERRLYDNFATNAYPAFVRCGASPQMSQTSVRRCEAALAVQSTVLRGGVSLGESAQRTRRPSSSERGTPVPNCSPQNRNAFAIAARALWPRKTAAELAFRAHVSERAAKFWLSGKREPSNDALMVMIEEMRPRKRA